jgi:hypothetical protein
MKRHKSQNDIQTIAKFFEIATHYILVVQNFGTPLIGKWHQLTQVVSLLFVVCILTNSNRFFIAICIQFIGLEIRM